MTFLWTKVRLWRKWHHWDKCPIKKSLKKMVNIVSWDDVKMVLGRLSHCPKIVTLVAWHFFRQKSHLYDKSSIFGTKVPSFWDKSLVIIKVYKNVTPLVWLECDSGTAVPLKNFLNKKKIFQFSVMIRIKQSDLFENQNIGQK